ncbi:MAG: c-type cytochrome [Nitrospinae bacterium]|nr:c-type cytochrome [Nitrospinota bacterium]
MVLIKIVLASLIIIMGFAGYTTWGIPLIVPEAPPVEEVLTGDITMEQYIAMGEKIYLGKGTCTLCHTAVGGRAPVLDTVAAAAAERIADAGYKGKATNAEEYIHESMVETSAYVVPGFGKPGTNDTVSPMPDVSKGAIGLSPVELNAVIAYLQSLGGVDVTVQLPTGDAGAVPADGEAPAAVVLAATAPEAFEKFECATCHIASFYPEGGDMGPNLTDMAKAAGARKKGLSGDEYLIESIRRPNAHVVEGFDEGMMPEDYPERMSLGEMYLIVDALMGRAEEGK